MNIEEQVKLWLDEYDEIPCRAKGFIDYLKEKGFTEVSREITSWGEDQYTYSLVIFSNGTQCFSVENNENSYGDSGFEWWSTVTEVFPVQKLVTVYEVNKPEEL